MQDALVSECEKADKQESVGKAPWILAPYQLVSWWDMEKFSAQTFFSIGVLMQKLKEEMGVPTGDPAFSFGQNVYLDPVKRNKVENVLQMIEAECLKISLRVSAGTISQFRVLLKSSDKGSLGYFVGHISSIEDTIRAELQQTLFLYMPCDRRDFYISPLKDWDEVLQRFPKLRVDVEEASKCYACDRYAGAIFHVLLVAEFGVIEVAKLFGVEGDKPGWGALERLERIHNKAYKDRSDIEKKHATFLENVIPLLLAVKDSWRHKITHVENRLVWLDTVFSPQIAEEVLSATRGFMRRLATDLPVWGI